eukprot:1054716-Rhodomonas_salina.1
MVGVFEDVDGVGVEDEDDNGAIVVVEDEDVTVQMMSKRMSTTPVPSAQPPHSDHSPVPKSTGGKYAAQFPLQPVLAVAIQPPTSCDTSRATPYSTQARSSSARLPAAAAA